MKTYLFAALLILGVAPLLAQTPTPAPDAPRTYSSDLGFVYTVPVEYVVMNMASSLPKIKQKVEDSATSVGENKGAACTEVAVTARHQSPLAVETVIALPFDCYGQVITDSDLPEFTKACRLASSKP